MGRDPTRALLWRSAGALIAYAVAVAAWTLRPDSGAAQVLLCVPALFWTGVYPEAVKKLRSPLSKDYFVDYCSQGKRSYYIASTFEDDPYREEAPVLRRLSEEYELCAYGLTQVRREWESMRDGGPGLAAAH